MGRTVTGLALGLALAGAPGPVQAVLLTEAVRGGAARGFRAMAGAYAVSGSVLLGLALGLSLSAPRGAVLRTLDALGGAVLLWLAVDGVRSPWTGPPAAPGRRTVPVPVRGALSVLLNPGGWVFFGTVASSLLSTAARLDGRAGALSAAAALLVGLAAGDGALVVFGGTGLRRGGEGVIRWTQRALAAVLAALGVWLLFTGITGR
jgi:threonine/homoserine/homoserine lactone efflux protein